MRLSVALALVLLPEVALAQSQSSTANPADVASALFQAIQIRDWPRAAALIHPDALVGFRDQLLAFAVGWEESKSQRPATLRSTNPVLDGFAGIASVDALKALPPQELFARYLTAQAPDPAAYDDGRPPVWTRTVVGVVAESDTLVHVVYRKHVDVGRYGETEETEVLTARLLGSDWRLLLNRDISIQGSVRIVRPPTDPKDH